MRESNFYFPTHNKASVCITSALYDRRAIDATSPLPLLSTLTHLSYLTSTSPRIRDILCSDGGLERLITILRSTGKRMREQRDQLRLITSSTNKPCSLAPPSHQLDPPDTFLSQSSIHSNNHLNFGNPSSIKPSSSSSSSSSSVSSLNHSGSRVEHNPQMSTLAPASLNLTSSTRPFVKSSPFRSFLPQPQPPALSDPHVSTGSTSPTQNDENEITPLGPPLPILQPPQPLAAHQAATVGLTREQKQLLWTWSLSFQCVVHIGVRGTESIRTRVVEAGVVPVIISVLGGYLHEMERNRQAVEARERARRKSQLLVPPPISNVQLVHSTSLSGASQQPFVSTSNTLTVAGAPNQPNGNIDANIGDESSSDFQRPPRPVLSSRTLTLPPSDAFPRTFVPGRAAQRPSDSSFVGHPTRDPHSRFSISATPSPNSTSLIASDAVHRPWARSTSEQQYSARSDGSGTLAPRETNTSNHIGRSSDLGFRTGSISPSSVSSSSSLETSRLVSGGHGVIRAVSPETLRDAMSSVSASTNSDGSSNLGAGRPASQQSIPVMSASRPGFVHDDTDEHSGAECEVDDCEADVVMDLEASTEPGPSTVPQRARRETIKAAASSNPAFVHITPLAPLQPTLTELSDDSLPIPHAAGQGPMEGVVEDRHQARGNSVEVESRHSSSFHTGHQTPRASTTQLPVHSSTQFSSSPTRLEPSVSSDTPRASSSGDVDMAPPHPPRPSLNPVSSASHIFSDDSISPRGPRLGGNGVAIPSATVTAATAHSQPLGTATAAAEATVPPVTFTHRQPDPVAENAGGGTGRTVAPSSISAAPQAPVSLGFRDEDVLLALQLLAYLSKYPHVRAHFHEPANRATLELTYGSLEEATRALGKFVGRFKGERQDREKLKETIHLGGSSDSSAGRRPASAHGSEFMNPGNSGLTREQCFERLRAHITGPRLYHHSQGPPFHHSHCHLHHSGSQPHRSVSSLNIREIAPRGEAPPHPNHHIQEGGSSEGGRGQGLDAGGHTYRNVDFGGRSVNTLAPPAPFSGGMSRQSSFGNGTFSINSTYGKSPAIFNFQPSGRPTPVTAPSSLQSINPLSSNVFSYVERFTHHRAGSSSSGDLQAIPNEIQYWAGVIMRNACRKDEDRGGIRQCANMQCGKWEEFPREFAKCRRCRKAKYCSKVCQSRAWQLGHRYWCSTKTDGEANEASNSGLTARSSEQATELMVTQPAPGAEIQQSRTAETNGNLVGVAIERLRQSASVASVRGEDEDLGSNIATPPDREPRVGFAGMIVRETHGVEQAGDNGGGQEDEFGNVDEGERVRMLVEGDGNGNGVAAGDRQ